MGGLNMDVSEGDLIKDRGKTWEAVKVDESQNRVIWVLQE